MDPHLLRTFVAVASCGSFSAAAEQLGYTQSAVSQHIAALESDLGTPLLHRRPVVPTPSGERLLEHAGPLLSAWKPRGLTYDGQLVSRPARSRWPPHRWRRHRSRPRSARCAVLIRVPRSP
ncbi:MULTISPECIES: LysR family transcriptional regulator [Kribbella]|uniref:LysR family transcriptional regulator n=1 Tax=Kribbella TaxID=182639 RepID=UPI002F6B174F